MHLSNSVPGGCPQGKEHSGFGTESHVAPGIAFPLRVELEHFIRFRHCDCSGSETGKPKASHVTWHRQVRGADSVDRKAGGEPGQLTL